MPPLEFMMKAVASGNKKGKQNLASPAEIVVLVPVSHHYIQLQIYTCIYTNNLNENIPL